MEDASPTKWHLAHSTWFFETFVLLPYRAGYEAFDPNYRFLFNSYYESAGPRHPRPRRGLLTRPSLAEVLRYRDHVDAAMNGLLIEEFRPEVLALITLGCHHEQQHQELLLTDLLHLFAQNPLQPVYRELQRPRSAENPSGESGWIRFDGGLIAIGHSGEAFAFDCETPRHRTWIEPFELADRAVINAEWIAFMEDGGYRNPLLWLSDGWSWLQSTGVDRPLYWFRVDREWWSMTLRGPLLLDLDAPVCHLSFYEADAFAAWAGARLPSEAEWEIAAQGVAIEGNFLNSEALRPLALPPRLEGGIRGLYGDVWEWTATPFRPYPGFRPASGAVGEYNGKFMSGQYVLRGGSCATPPGHVRATYRNFFGPEKRWQFSGLRLARSVY